jgi:transcriptional regulator with XRE-family HTH domain
MSSETLGDRLKVVRKFLELNQEAVSHTLHITNQTLSRYEKGTRFPDSQFLQEFGSIFKVNANWLLYGLGDIFLEDSDNDPGNKDDIIKQLDYYLDKIKALFLKQKNRGQDSLPE